MRRNNSYLQCYKKWWIGCTVDGITQRTENFENKNMKSEKINWSNGPRNHILSSEELVTSISNGKGLFHNGHPTLCELKVVSGVFVLDQWTEYIAVTYSCTDVAITQISSCLPHSQPNLPACFDGWITAGWLDIFSCDQAARCMIGRFRIVTSLNSPIAKKWHKALSSIKEVPYCFSRTPLKFQDHTAKPIVDFDPNWPFPYHNYSLNSLMAMKWCTKLKVTLKRCPSFSRSSAKFQGHRAKKSLILTQFVRFWTITRVWIHQWLRNDARSVK